MQLAVSANAPAGTTIEVTPDVWKIVWITVVVIVCLTIVGCLTAYCCRKYKEKKQARERGSSLTQKSRLLDRSGDVVYGDFEKDSVSVGEI
jgi:heme/copper-type cytochrome/quinol oxidase subunit 2